jgi:hypothetical protein
VDSKAVNSKIDKVHNSVPCKGVGIVINFKDESLRCFLVVIDNKFQTEKLGDDKK